MGDILSEQYINIYNGSFRLLMALVAGGMVGINRERLNRAAGFRTHILICMGSCLLMLISIYIPQQYLSFKSGDPGRIAAQVVTGIGFLGAGAIIKLGDHVKGLTTAASIWVSAAIGLAVGAGMLWLALAAVILLLFSLIILERLERYLFKKRIFKTIFIQMKQPTANLQSVEDILDKFKVKYTIQEYRHNMYLGILYVEINITVDNKFNNEDFINSFSDFNNIQEISIKNRL